MKLIYSTDDRDKLKNLLQDWILSRKGSIMSALSARKLFSDVYGIDIDHHEYAYILDYLHNIKAISYYEHNYGDTAYIISPPQTS